MKVCVMHEAGHGSDIVSQVVIVASILLGSVKASIDTFKQLFCVFIGLHVEA